MKKTTAKNQEFSSEVELLTRVASLYYIEDRTQAEIAKQLGLSRPKVGRLLQKAREQEIVQIRINAHPSLSLQLESELLKRFALKGTLLVGDQRDVDTERMLLARMVADYIARNAKAGDVVAVGMGRNVGAVPEQIAPTVPRAVTIISAMGGSALVAPPINPNDICRRMAEALGGRSEGLYAPAYAESKEVRDYFMSHEDIAQTLDRARRANMALVGIGDARNESAVVQMGCFSVQDMMHLREAGAVGDILGHFFDVQGVLIERGMTDRTIGLSFDDLCHIPCVIGIASEPEKKLSILGALRSGMIDVLATSVSNARTLLMLDERVGSA